jgi:hypothetical protein
MMAVKTRPLTNQQLAEFFGDYRKVFASWSVEHDVVLVRGQGPIVQRIGFEPLRDGAYRPSCSVEVLIVGVRILHRYLDIKHREILPRNHVAKMPLVIKAMEEQFQPSIRKPLDVGEVVRLGEQEVARDSIDNANHLSALAALNAHVGDAQRALHWCERVDERLAKKGAHLADWETRLLRFAMGLREALKRGDQQAFLAAPWST